MILKRYGREAYRIFRLLSKAGRLVETDKVTTLCNLTILRKYIVALLVIALHWYFLTGSLGKVYMLKRWIQ